MMKASAVQANDPIKLINRPNLGTKVAKIAVNKTMSVLKNKRLVGRKLLRVGIFLYKFEDSMISKTGMSCMG